MYPVHSYTQPPPSSDRPPVVLLLELMPLPSYIINDPESTLTWGFSPGAGHSMASDKCLMTRIHYSISPSSSTALKICARCSFIPFDFWTMYTYSRKQHIANILPNSESPDPGAGPLSRWSAEWNGGRSWHAEVRRGLCISFIPFHPRHMSGYVGRSERENSPGNPCTVLFTKALTKPQAITGFKHGSKTFHHS